MSNGNLLSYGNGPNMSSKHSGWNGFFLGCLQVTSLQLTVTIMYWTFLFVKLFIIIKPKYAVWIGSEHETNNCNEKSYSKMSKNGAVVLN